MGLTTVRALQIASVKWKEERIHDFLNGEITNILDQDKFGIVSHNPY
jgi:hypothetical protein